MLAREISAIAHGLHASPDPATVQTIQIAIDALVLPEVMPFWRAVLGYQDRGNGDEDLLDPRGRGPLFWFHRWRSRARSATGSMSTSGFLTTWPRRA